MLQIKKLAKYYKKPIVPILLNELKSLQKSSDLEAIIASLLFLLAAPFIPNVKLFFVASFILLAFLVWKYGFIKAFIYIILPISLIHIGQTHYISIIPQSKIMSPQYFEDIRLTFTITSSFIISCASLLLIPWFYKNKIFKEKLFKHEKLLIALFACAILSSLYGSLMPGLSLFAAFSQFSILIWAWYLINYLKSANQTAKTKILFSILLILAVMICYESLIVFAQQFIGSTLGIKVESTQYAVSFGSGADEGGGGFRPLGLQSHPNGMANNQLILLSSIILLLSFLKKKIILKPLIKRFLTITIIFSTISIILSLSRAVYIAYAIGIAIYILYFPDSISLVLKKIKGLNKKINVKIKITFILLLLTLVVKFTNRMLNTVYSFAQDGGVETRIKQYAEAIEVFKKSPIFGIGDSMFIPTSYQLFPNGIMVYFPENVHNGFLLFLIERGILSAIIYIIALILTYAAIVKLKINKTNKVMIYSVAIANYVIMFFHPERNFLSLLIVLILILIHYEKNHSLNQN